MKILITGGAGMIGQAIAKEHLDYVDEVYIYDNKSNPFNDYSSLVGIDCSDRNLKELIETENFDIISHQAASVGVGESQYNIVKYCQNNITFTAELLQAILDTKKFPKYLILASSMGPYGEGMGVAGEAIKEDHPRNPQSIYAITKQTQEEMFRVFAETYEVTTFALRYFSVYGIKANPNNPYTGVLSIIANKILNNNVVELNEDGLQTRDLISAEDCAKAHLYVTGFVRNEDDKFFFPFNIGTGKSVTIKSVAEKMIAYLHPAKELRFNGQYRKGDIKHSKADTTLAYNYLGFEAQDDIDTSIQKYCTFIKENKELFTIKDTCEEEQEKLKALNLIK